jgi:hypothetical protein
MKPKSINALAKLVLFTCMIICTTQQIGWAAFPIKEQQLITQKTIEDLPSSKAFYTESISKDTKDGKLNNPSNKTDKGYLGIAALASSMLGVGFLMIYSFTITLPMILFLMGVTFAVLGLVLGIIGIGKFRKNKFLAGLAIGLVCYPLLIVLGVLVLLLILP